MRTLVHLIAISVILACTSLAWLILAGVMDARTHDQQSGLYSAVGELWGHPQQQQAPTLMFTWTTQERRAEQRVGPRTGQSIEQVRWVTVSHDDRVHPDSSVLEVDLALDQRRKGLLWFSLYDVDFEANYRYTHVRDEAGVLTWRLPFPDASGLYDDLRFVVDGVEIEGLQPDGSALVYAVDVAPGQAVDLQVAYRSRGLDEWTYRPGNGVTSLEDFSLTLQTDFAAIDYPANTLSPSNKRREGTGWVLDWTFDRVVTGRGMGMVMPQRVQPGPLAREMSLSAPISLAMFILVLMVLATLRGLSIHPVNYFFLSSAFFSFHLLFGYLADHLAVEAAFAVSSVVAMVLVVTYLRLVVSNRFAFGPAAVAQLVYLIGFSLAHFADGFTGLTITVLSILTLFLLMQLTGHIDWDATFSGFNTASKRKAPHSSPDAEASPE